MSNVRDSDTSLWLHNKLGTSNDSWAGGSICSQLNSDVLRNIKECFPDLQTQVKLKLLLSFFQIPKKNVQDWKIELEEILEIAQVDCDRWVSVLAEIMRTYPSTLSLNTESLEVKENKRIFDELVHDLKKQLKKPIDFNMLPMECHYLNKSALANLIGHPPVTKKHFTLKRKPKSAAVKADLIQKSIDVANNMKKNISPAVPVRSRGMPRKMTDTTPLKGIPSRIPSGGFRTSIMNTSMSRTTPARPLSGRKDCAIKLLDITEQPMGYVQAKKRKRMMEIEESKRMSDDVHVSEPPSVVESTTEMAPPTPDYAAGLTAANPPTPSPVCTTIVTPPTPMTPMTPMSPMTPMTPMTPMPMTPVTPMPMTPMTPVVYPSMSPPPPTPSYSPVIVDGQDIDLKEEKINLHDTVLVKNYTSYVKSDNDVQEMSSMEPMETIETQHTDSLDTSMLGSNHHQIADMKEEQLIMSNEEEQPSVLTNMNMMDATKSIIMTSNETDVYSVGEQVRRSLMNISNNFAQHQTMNGSQFVTITPTMMQIKSPLSSVALASRTSSGSLSKEQLHEAQEMFKTANKVTRPEKALILGFMAGSRENPCPQLGNIVTIKLSENQKNVQQEDGSVITVMVETHFQMNYCNGQYKQIKKYMGLNPNPINSFASVATGSGNDHLIQFN